MNKVKERRKMWIVEKNLLDLSSQNELNAHYTSLNL